MDSTLLQSTASTAAQTVTVAATMATTTVRNGQHNGTHLGVNVHGRLMYDEIVINDVWINVILSTLAMTCAACVCLCFLYFKFQQWKQAVQERRKEKNSRKYDDDSLPSYTIVTGLPTYDEALERMKNLSASKPSAAAGTKQSAANAKQPAISVVQVKNEVAPPKPETKFGLVSHSLIVHDSGCSHCLSVQELLETYNVR